MEESPSEIKELLERNIALSEEILKHAKKTHHHLMWDRVFGTIKTLIILAPFIAAVWYFPKYASQIMGFSSDIGKQFDAIQKQMQQLGDMQKQIPKK